MATPALEVRWVRASDRERVVELCQDVWEGNDYLPQVFDDWVGDPGAWFQAAEAEGELVGLQRLRPLSPGLAWYEGLRVAAAWRRRGVARRMLEVAIELARSLGFEEIRLATGNPAARPLFESSGFRLLLAPRFWTARRMEGGEPARIPPPAEAPSILELVGQDPGLAAYGGVTADFQGARDLDRAELERLAGTGQLRLLGGGRALAVIRSAPRRTHLGVTFLAGRGGILRELLMALRFEADAEDLEGVSVALPPGHPAAADLEAVGYDLRPESEAFIYSLRLNA